MGNSEIQSSNEEAIVQGDSLVDELKKVVDGGNIEKANGELSAAFLNGLTPSEIQQLQSSIGMVEGADPDALAVLKQYIGEPETATTPETTPETTTTESETETETIPEPAIATAEEEPETETEATPEPAIATAEEEPETGTETIPEPAIATAEEEPETGTEATPVETEPIGEVLEREMANATELKEGDAQSFVEYAEQHDKTLSLNNLKSISTADATILAGLEGGQIYLNGLETLSVDTLQAFVNGKCLSVNFKNGLLKRENVECSITINGERQTTYDSDLCKKLLGENYKEPETTPGAETETTPETTTEIETETSTEKATPEPAIATAEEEPEYNRSWYERDDRPPYEDDHDEPRSQPDEETETATTPETTPKTTTVPETTTETETATVPETKIEQPTKKLM